LGILFFYNNLFLFFYFFSCISHITTQRYSTINLRSFGTSHTSHSNFIQLQNDLQLHKSTQLHRWILWRTPIICINERICLQQWTISYFPKSVGQRIDWKWHSSFNCLKQVFFKKDNNQKTHCFSNLNQSDIIKLLDYNCSMKNLEKFCQHGMSLFQC